MSEPNGAPVGSGAATTFQSETAPLRRVLLRDPSHALGSQARVDASWRALGYTARPDVTTALAEMEAFAALLSELGVTIEWAGGGEGLGPDALYVRDPAVVTDAGIVGCRMGKEARMAEPASLADGWAALGVPVAGSIGSPGTLEGGDVVWVDRSTLAVGRGYRTNQAGLDQLRSLVGPSVEVVRVPLPHHRGPSDILHLMSLVSPLADDLALVYSPLLPVPFREWLLDRGIELVEVPDDEMDSLGCNVLAVRPRVVVAVDGNPETRRRLEAVGVEVHAYRGAEISVKGCGGPTCLTRTLERNR